MLISSYNHNIIVDIFYPFDKIIPIDEVSAELQYDLFPVHACCSRLQGLWLFIGCSWDLCSQGILSLSPIECHSHCVTAISSDNLLFLWFLLFWLKLKYDLGVGQEDPSLVLALASVWSFLLTFSSLALLVPTIYTISLAYQDAVNSRLSPSSTTSALEFLTTLNGILFMGLGSLIGYPIALASGKMFLCGESFLFFENAVDKVFNSGSLLYGVWTWNPRLKCHTCEMSLCMYS